MMNKSPWLYFCAAATICLGGIIAPTPARGAANYYTAGARFHTTHKSFEEYPFSNSDISWQAGMEFHEGVGYWQLIVGYAPSIKETTKEDDPIAIDSVITPQLNLIIQDRGWLAGAGAYAFYIRTDEENDWSKIYWQTMIGYEFQMKAFDISIMGIYSFDRWGNISDFRFGDLETSVMIKKKF
ncbi:MAG: hypothetical protein ACNA71_07720 [Kiritimatiellia bacterium]